MSLYMSIPFQEQGPRLYEQQNTFIVAITPLLRTDPSVIFLISLTKQLRINIRKEELTLVHFSYNVVYHGMVGMVGHKADGSVSESWLGLSGS